MNRNRRNALKNIAVFSMAGNMFLGKHTSAIEQIQGIHLAE